MSRYLIVVREYDDDPISEARTYSEPRLAYVASEADLGFTLRYAICDAQRIANDGIEHQLTAVAYDYVDHIAVRAVDYDPIRGQFIGWTADEIDEVLQIW